MVDVADRPTLDETIALLEATLDATHDGIVVFDLNRQLIRVLGVSVVESYHRGNGGSAGLAPAGSGVRAVFNTIASIV